MSNALEFSTSLIFDNLYLVRYRLLEATSVEDMKLFGTPVTGVAAIDKAYYNQFVTAGLSIAQMAELNHQGVPLRVINHADVLEIYKSISLHISNFKTSLKYTVNVNPSLREDLMKLDKLSMAIYEHAKYQLIGDNEFDELLRSKLEVVSVTPGNLFVTPAAKKPEESVEEAFPERVSLNSDDTGLIFKRPKY